MNYETKTLTYRFGEKVAVDNVSFLNTELEHFFQSENIRRIIFDLENVSICDLYGIHFFLQFQRRAENANKALFLYRPQPILIEILKNAGIVHVFTVIDTIEESWKSAKIREVAYEGKKGNDRCPLIGCFLSGNS